MPCTLQATLGMPWQMWPLAAAWHGPCHPITRLRLAMCSQPRPPPPTQSALQPRTPRRSLAVHRCAIWAPKPPSPAARLLACAAAHAFAGRLRADDRVWASFSARSSQIYRAARRDGASRPAVCVARSAGATRARSVGRIEAHVFFILVHAYLGTSLGSDSDLGRFGHA